MRAVFQCPRAGADVPRRSVGKRGDGTTACTYRTFVYLIRGDVVGVLGASTSYREPFRLVGRTVSSGHVRTSSPYTG